MSKVKALESEIESLSPDDLNAFRVWFTKFDAGIWDRQIERDATNGKLIALAESALRDHASGRSTGL